MSSIHALRAWAIRTAQQLFSRRRIAIRVFAALVVVALWAGDASAQFTVSSNVDDGTGGTVNTLSWAINQANANPGSTINFNSALNGVTITLAGNLPPILVNMTIDGSAVPNLKIDGAGRYSAFFVDTGTVAIKGLTIANTNSVGGAGGNTSPQGGGGGGGLGAGGALFVNNAANVTIQNVSFQNNSATGGAGGNSTGVGFGGGGGGGGFHGAGGSTNTGSSAGAGGGGGGGLNGVGGSAAGLYAGSGGGGAYGSGGSSSSGFTFNGGGGGGSLLPGGAGSSSHGGSGGVTGGGAGGTDGGAGPSTGGVGGGGGGGAYQQSGANGGLFGGGGGEGYNQANGSGGQGGDFGGGGGGNRLNGHAGAGGFGGGGGGGSVFNGTPAAGGFGGGTGGSGGNRGDGGDGLGGAIFVRTGGTLTIVDSGITGSAVTGGQGGSGSGTAAGAALYTMAGVSANVQVTTGSQTVANSISGEGGITKTGVGTLILSGTNDYSGGTTVSAGTLRGDSSSLQGDITNNAGVTFNQTTTGTYAGAMTGSGALTKIGSGTLTITGANGYGGGTTISAGTLQGDTTSLQGAITNNAAITFNQTTDGTYASAIGGTGSLTKIGAATLTLSGTNTYSGTTEVTAGKLLVDGSIASGTPSTTGVTVDQGATLGGSGTINGNVVSNGNVAPGDPVTMTINGSFTQGAGGNFQVAIDNLGNTPGVNSSLLIVNGAASVAGTVEVQPAAGTYTPGTRYIFLEANSLTGRFSGVTVDSLPYTQALLGYGTIGGFADAYFTLQSDYASAAQTPNQIAVANYIDQNSGNPNLQNLINTLNTLSAPGVRGALDQMSGALYGSVAQTDFQSTTLELSFITNRISSGLMGMGDSGPIASNNSSFSSQMGTLASSSGSDLVVRGQNTFSPLSRPAGGTSTWGFGYGLGGNAQGNGNAAGLNYSLGGTVAGIEAIDDNKVNGLYAGYVGSHLGSYIAGQSVGVNGGQLGFYRRVDDGRNYYILLGGLGADGYNSRRLMDFGGINTTANANYGGWQSQAYLERGVTLRGAWASIQPYAALQYLYVRQNAFTETGAGSLNLAVSGIDANSLRSLVGVRIAGNGAALTGGRRLTPLVRALWLHEFLGTSTGLNAQFAPIGGTNFAVTGTSLGRDWAILGTGLNWNLGGGWQTYANYDAQVNVAQTFHVGSGGFQYTW
jgi:autotransporter-associated beta strand protein